MTPTPRRLAIKSAALLALAVAGAVAGCANLTPAQTQAAITAVVQTGATLGSTLGGTQAAQWIADGGLVCKLSQGYIAVTGINVTGTPATVMEGICNGLGGTGSALPSTVAPASVPVAALAAAKPTT
jgi:hypothetical protein